MSKSEKFEQFVNQTRNHTHPDGAFMLFMCGACIAVAAALIHLIGFSAVSWWISLAAIALTALALITFVIHNICDKYLDYCFKHYLDSIKQR